MVDKYNYFIAKIFKDLPGCELLKKKLLKREEDIHMKNKNPQEKERRGKIPLDLDLKEFRELFSFDFADVKK